MKRALLTYRHHRYILSNPICLIGRELECDFCLDDPSVSRKHAVIVNSGSRYHVLDYKSSNGLYVNGEPVFKAQLSHGDTIRLGDVNLTFLFESHFAFGPDIQVENYEGLFNSGDMLDVLAKTFSELATEKKQKYNFIFEFEEDIRESRNSQDLLDRGLNRLLNELRADRGFIAMYNEKLGEMDVRASEGLDTVSIPGNPFYFLVMKQAFINSQIILTTESLFEYFYQEPRLIFLGIGSALCAPIIRLGAPCGIVYLDRKMASRPFREGDERLLAVYVYRLSLTLESMRLMENLRENLEIVDILSTKIGQGISSMKCEICGEPLNSQDLSNLVVCLECNTIHHRDCWEYNGGCPIYGCNSTKMRPLDKI